MSYHLFFLCVLLNHCSKAHLPLMESLHHPYSNASETRLDIVVLVLSTETQSFLSTSLAGQGKLSQTLM